MSKIVAYANMKGGVGKTTLALSMAEASASMRKNVLVVDLDLQINASMTLAGDGVDDMLRASSGRRSINGSPLSSLKERNCPSCVPFTIRERLLRLLNCGLVRPTRIA
jgi:cellulose biosynthesis protein BcsQ